MDRLRPLTPRGTVDTMSPEAGKQGSGLLAPLSSKLNKSPAMMSIFAIKEVDIMSKTVLAVLTLALAITIPCFAGNNPNYKVAVHVLPRDCQRNCAFDMPDINGPCDIQATYDGPGEFEFFPVFYDLAEVKCLEYAVEWTGDYQCAYSACSFTHIGEIVWSGDWMAQCFNGCQPGPVMIPGWGWIEMDKPGTICVVPAPHPGRIGVLDCTGENIDIPVATFCAGVLGAPGDDPCKGLARATEPTTWSKVKSMFR